MLGREGARKRRVYLIDFGLCKRTRMENGELFPERVFLDF
jgi:hypothetical protein